VAQLAGLPSGVVRRAREVLRTLEGEHRVVSGAPPPAADPGQFALFGSADPPPHPVLDEIRGLDLDGMTPREALLRLAELQRRAGEVA
jgi:DNA mismatch repair protein MutS